MIAVEGKPAPIPRGRMASRNTIAAMHPAEKIHPLSSIAIAIVAWQVAMKLTTTLMLFANQPLIKFLYQLLQVKSAYSRYVSGFCRQVFQLAHDAHAKSMKNESLAMRGHFTEATSCSTATRLAIISSITYS